MDRAFSSGASGTPPSAPVSPSTGYATSGNPGTATPATKPGAWWYHMVTEELRRLIVDAGLTPDYTNTAQISQAVQALVGAINPAGVVSFFARNTAPTGWLKANGAAVSRTTYAPLFAAIGTTFGSGDGSTTFNLPDLRGEFLRGWDDARGVDSGRSFASAQSSQNLSHNHTLTQNGIFDGGGSAWGIPVTNTGGNANAPTGGVPVVSMGTNGGTEARPRNISLLACIKF